MTIQRARFWGKKTSSQSQARMNFASGGPRVTHQIAGYGSQQLAALRAIVDDLNYGIVVLDQERRVQFINRAFRRFWRVPDAAGPRPADISQADVSRPRHDRLRRIRTIKLGDYVAKQLDLIRTGEERPLNIRLSNGEVIQFRCKALPDGGRLLTYGNVSELAAGPRHSTARLLRRH